MLLILPVGFYVVGYYWSPHVASWLSTRVTSLRIPHTLTHADAVRWARTAGLIGLAMDVTLMRSGDPR